MPLPFLMLRQRLTYHYPTHVVQVAGKPILGFGIAIPGRDMLILIISIAIPDLDMLILMIRIAIPGRDMLILISSIAIPEGGIAIPDARIAIPGAWIAVPNAWHTSGFVGMRIQTASIAIHDCYSARLALRTTLRPKPIRVLAELPWV